MELFTVNRYDTVEKPSDPDRENRILKNLQRNIDKKKHNKKQDVKTTKLETTLQSPEEIIVPDTNQASVVQDDVAPEPKHNPKELASAVTTDEQQRANPLAEPTGDFMVLGKDKFQKKQHIDMVLPPWLTSPTIISNDLSSKDTNLKPIDDIDYLSDQIKANLASIQIKELFPVQHTVIPWILDVHDKPQPFRPRDICVSAPTGSGKTLAYALPIVQILQNRTQRSVRALIVLPVNELAVQVHKVFKKLCEGTSLTCTLLSKFTSFEAEQSQLLEQYEGVWHSKVDIVIATTGRLVEHLHFTTGFSLKTLQFLVMDEADRIMEQIHNNWLYHLDSHVKQQSDSVLAGRAVSLCYSELRSDANRQPQKLLFSATLSQDPEKLQGLQLFQPKLFTAIVSQFEVATKNNPFSTNDEQRGDFVGKYTTPLELTEKFCITQAELKPLTLYTMIVENKWKRFLCFTNSGESAHRLSFVLQQLLGDEMRIEELSSGLSPNLRNSVLTKFQMGHINGLICSDALARGIDVQDVDIVISYEMPRHIKTYIHRVGRTGRAGKQGLAVTMLLKHEMPIFDKLIKEGGKLALAELKLTSNTEELKAKEYASVVEKLQVAIKREQQIKVMKQVNEKQKQNKVQSGLFGQLQSQLQSTEPSSGHHGYVDEPNVPESWKWQNQQNIMARKERKGKANKRKNKMPNEDNTKGAAGGQGAKKAKLEA